MDFVNTVLSSAKNRIMALEIANTAMLTDFLEEAAAIDLTLTSRELIDEAIKAGLYAFMGKQYQLGLDYIIGLASDAIAHGLITSESGLASYLTRKAPLIANGIDAERVLMDLKIDARQGGLFERIRERSRETCRLPMAVVA